MEQTEAEIKLEELKLRHEEYFSDSEHSLTRNQVEHIWNALIQKMLLEAMQWAVERCMPEVEENSGVSEYYAGYNRCRLDIISKSKEIFGEK